MPALACLDWRELPTSAVASLYLSEVDRWATTLSWDTSSDWSEVELGRLLGHVPGYAVTNDRGTVVGWTFFIVLGHELQIGGLVSGSEECTEQLLTAVMTDPRTAGATVKNLFAFTDAPGLESIASRHGLAVDRYRYLWRPVEAVGQPDLTFDVRTLQPGDGTAITDLLVRAYAGSGASTPFAPRGERAEWEHYVTQILSGHGCGTIQWEGSLCVPSESGGLSAVALVSRIAPETAHLVQLAVDPKCQSRGLGRFLLGAATDMAGSLNYRRLTLLVSGRDSRAGRFYERAGFHPSATFVSAVSVEPRDQPRRLTSVDSGACVTTLR